MHSLRKWVASRPVIAFYLLTILFSWSYWLALLALGQQVRPGSSATHLPGLMGPMIAAVVVTALASGKRGLRELMLSALVLPRPRLRNAMLALSPVAIGCVVFLVLAAAGTPLPFLLAFSTYPGLPYGMPILLLFLFALVLNGYGEEVGWRGFATERLVPRLGKVKATLLVSAMWLVWHTPLFWLNANMQALVGPIIFGWAFGLLCGAFVLAGLYLTSGHSILVPLLNFEWVAGHGEGRGNPRVVRLREQSSRPESGQPTRGQNSIRPAAGRMNAGFPPSNRFGACVASAVLRRLLPDQPSLRTFPDWADFTHSNFNRAILVVAFWHTFYNFTVATQAGTGTAAAVISSVVMAWGTYFAYAWWRDARNERAA